MLIGRTHTVRILLVTAMLALVSVCGYYQVCEWVAKWAFSYQSYFAADELILIKLPQADLSQQNDFLASEGEFEWQGEMVDVIHRELRADTLFIYGFRDKAETNLKRQAAWLYQDTAQSGNQPIRSRSNTKRIKWFSPFILPVSGVITPVERFVKPRLTPLFSYTSIQIRLPFLDVFAPPPNRWC